MAERAVANGSVGSGDPHVFHPAGIHELANKVDGLADRLDALDARMPSHVDAGIYAPHITEHLNDAVANVAALILRLRAAAETLHATADGHQATEEWAEEEASILPTTKWGAMLDE